MRVLITGAAGFLGSHLCDRFLADGHSVVGLDNFVTGHADNIAHLTGNDRFAFVRHNISAHTYIEGPLDGVLHFASPASPVDYLELPIQTLKVGSLGTHNALGIALAKRARFFLASTSEVYGDPLVHPQPEGYWGNVNPIGPRGVYDEAKRFAEAITMAYHRFHGVDTRIVRIFNTYGERMRPHDGRVVSNFIVQALEGSPITIYGDGLQTRSFCYVEDEIEGIYRLFNQGDANPTNIGNPVEYTVRQLADIVVELTGTTVPIIHRPLPEDDPKVRQPDISRARAMLGWTPAIDVREGIRRTIAYFSGLVGTPRMAASAMTPGRVPARSGPRDSAGANCRERGGVFRRCQSPPIHHTAGAPASRCSPYLRSRPAPPVSRSRNTTRRPTCSRRRLRSTTPSGGTTRSPGLSA